jgi:hypothetical protein
MAIQRESGGWCQSNDRATQRLPVRIRYEPSGFIACAEDWVAAPAFFAEIGIGQVALILFGGIYSGLSTGSSIGALSLYVEGGYFGPALAGSVKALSIGGAHTEVGVGAGFEQGLGGIEDFKGTRFDLEGVLQFGPAVYVRSAHGQYLFIGSSISFGGGLLIGSKQFTYVWETGLAP